MADNNMTTYGGATGANCFKEAVSVNAGRVYDSCSSKDCLEDLRVYFTQTGQTLINDAQNVKCRRVEVINVIMDVESVPFNQGFCSVDLTFYFLVTLDVYSGTGAPAAAQGLAAFSKKVILYGSEGNVRVFRSDSQYSDDCEVTSMPRACVQVVDPVALSCKLVDCPRPCECSSIPQSVACRYDGCFVQPGSRSVCVTLGLFTIVQLERQVQMLVPAYDFCIPDKECVSATTDDPCELFKKIKFPTNAFFPPRISELDDDGCGCCCK